MNFTLPKLGYKQTIKYLSYGWTALGIYRGYQQTDKYTVSPMTYSNTLLYPDKFVDFYSKSLTNNEQDIRTEYKFIVHSFKPIVTDYYLNMAISGVLYHSPITRPITAVKEFATVVLY